MTGNYGFPSGLNYLKSKKCTCGNYFNGPGKCCDECFFKKSVAKPAKCKIENAQGRCELGDQCEHYSKCLQYCSDNDWDGWRVINGC